MVSIINHCSKRPEIIKAKYISVEEYNILSGGEQVIVDTSISIYFSQGFTLYQKEFYDSARIIFDIALSINNTDWRIYYYLGMIATRFQEYEKAEMYLQSGLTYSPDDKKKRSLIYVALGKNDEQQGSYEKAKQRFIMALNLNQYSKYAKQGLKRLGLLSEIEH